MTERFVLSGLQVRDLAYGENPHQKEAFLFSTNSDNLLALDRFQFIEGGDPSFNNLSDVDRLTQTLIAIASGFQLNHGEVPLMAVVVKHGNACGAAISRIGEPIEEQKPFIIQAMLSGDPEATLGGWVMLNFPVDEQVAILLAEKKLHGVVAPKFSSAAVLKLRRYSGKCRLVLNPALATVGRHNLEFTPIVHPVIGGFMTQLRSRFVPNFRLKPGEVGEIISYHPDNGVGDKQAVGLLFAWGIGSTSDSNSVTIVKLCEINNVWKLLGNGVCQRTRVGAGQLAVDLARRAGHALNGAVAYSDSFFPFTDGPEVLIQAGIRSIFATSGSIRDQEVIDYCRARGCILSLVPDEIGRGFFGH